MSLGEFELIRRYFAAATGRRDDVVLGIGDDCALVHPAPATELAITLDTLVEGVHFFAGVDPEALGHKALAVNLSDLAAMGAEPAWVTLALTLPQADAAWLEGFCRGFAALAARYGVQLIGGDTTRGPLSITIQAQGLLPVGQGLRRAGATVGDLIYVTGTLGDAGLALRAALQGAAWEAVDAQLRRRLERPEPRVEAGRALLQIASAAIDVSDGLLADLGHILEASDCGAQIELPRLPLSPRVAAALGPVPDWSLPMTAGDDYELCFTAPPSRAEQIARISTDLDLPITLLGRIEASAGLRCLQEDGSLWYPPTTGYEHFSTDD